MSKRTNLASVLEKAGFLRLLEALPRSPGVLIINHHRVGDIDAEPFDREVYEATTAQFEERVSTLKRRFGLISLPELQDFIAYPHKLRHFHAMLTFDDGYLDNFTVAMPVLKAHGASATFFLCTSLMGSSFLPWWDRAAYMVRSCASEVLDLKYPTAARIDLQPDREAAIIKVLRLFKAPAANSEESPSEQEFLGHLSEATGIALPQESERRFMNWTEAREMLHSGMSIGSHTHSHNILSRLPFSQQCEELSRSRQQLEENLHTRIDALAYPVGARDTFDSDTWRALEITGYKTAFSHYYGVNTPRQMKMCPFDLKRTKPTQNRQLFRMNTSLAVAFKYA